MSTFLLNLIMWLPFIVVFLISGIVFCITGYKRGLWRGLVSLGVTLVSVLLSLLFVRLLNRPIAKLAVWIMEKVGVADGDGMWLSAAEVGVQGLFVLLGFSFFMLVFSIVGKSLADKYLKKYMMTEQTGMRWGGLGVRFVDAFVFTIMLLLPLYGSVATLAPAVDSLLSLSSYMEKLDAESDMDNGDVAANNKGILLVSNSVGIDVNDMPTNQTAAEDDIQTLLNAAMEHPLTRISSGGPTSFVYSSLSTISTERGGMDVASAVETLDETIRWVHDLISLAEEEKLTNTDVLEFTHFLREDVVKQDWCYTICMKVYDLFAQLPDIQSFELEEELAFFGDISQKDFIINANALLEMAECVLQDDVFNKFEDISDEAELYALLEENGIIQKWGETMNASSYAVTARSLVVKTAVEKDSALYNPVIKAWAAEATDDAALQLAQAKAFFALMSATEPVDIATASMMLPSMDREALKAALLAAPAEDIFSWEVNETDDIFSDYLAGNQFGATDGQHVIIGGFGFIEEAINPTENLEKYLGGERELREVLWSLMTDNADTGCKYSAYDRFVAYISLSNLGENGRNPAARFVTVEDAAWAYNKLGEAYFSQLDRESASVAYDLIGAFVSAFDGDDDEFYVDTLMDLAKLAEVLASDADMESVYGIFSDIAWNAKNSEDGICEINLYSVIHVLTERFGADPIGIGAFISESEADYIYENLINEAQEKYREELCSFFGLASAV